MGIKDIFSGGVKSAVSGVLDGASGIISKLKADPTKVVEVERDLETLRVNAELKITELANDLEKAYLADTQNSRDANVKIQESDKASWLAKNVGYCIDIFLILVFCAMLIVIIYKVVPVDNKELFYTSFGLLGSYVGQSISFHRGTSAGSHAKQKQLDSIIKK